MQAFSDCLWSDFLSLCTVIFWQKVDFLINKECVRTRDYTIVLVSFLQEVWLKMQCKKLKMLLHKDCGTIVTRRKNLGEWPNQIQSLCFWHLHRVDIAPMYRLCFFGISCLFGLHISIQCCFSLFTFLYHDLVVELGLTWKK